MKLPIFKKRLIVRLPLDFLSFRKTKIHDFHSGLFSREVTSLFESELSYTMQTLFFFHLI